MFADLGPTGDCLSGRVVGHRSSCLMRVSVTIKPLAANLLLMRRLAIVGIGVVLALALGAGVVAGEDLEIEAINGEDPDQVNEVSFYRGEPIEVDLAGVDEDETRLDAQIDGSSFAVIDGEIIRADTDIDEGQYTLTIEHSPGGAIEQTVSTEIEIVEATDPREDDDRDIVEPTPFDIAAINGEDPDQVNEVAFYRGEPIELELDGIDESEGRFDARMDGSSFTFIEGELHRGGEEIEEGEYTLTIEHVARGTEDDGYTASTEIEITDVTPPREERDEIVEPTEFTVAAVDGEDADQVNEIALPPGSNIEIELAGIDEEAARFEAEINGTTVPFHEGELMRGGQDIEEGEYTLTIEHTPRDDEGHSASTEIEITETEREARDEPDRDRPDVEPTDFSIVAVDGEDPDQVNEVEWPFDVELDGIDAETARFEATIGDEEVAFRDGQVTPRGATLDPGTYTVTITHIPFGEAEEGHSASTDIELTAPPRTDGPPDEDRPTPDEETDHPGVDEDDEEPGGLGDLIRDLLDSLFG